MADQLPDTFSEFMQRMDRINWPIAPDFPRGFVPRVFEPHIAAAEVIYALVGGMQHVFVWAGTAGRLLEEDELFEVLPPETQMLIVPCDDEEDLVFLREFVADIKAALNPM